LREWNKNREIEIQVERATPLSHEFFDEVVPATLWPFVVGARLRSRQFFGCPSAAIVPLVARR